MYGNTVQWVNCYFTVLRYSLAVTSVLESRMPPRTKKLLNELEAWCNARGYGSRTEVARAIGVKRQAVTDWFAERQEPTGEQVLAIQEFLRKQERKGK